MKSDTTVQVTVLLYSGNPLSNKVWIKAVIEG